MNSAKGSLTFLNYLKIVSHQSAKATVFVTAIGATSTVPASTSTSPAGDVLWNHTKETAKGAFDKTGLTILGIGALATVVAFNQDQAVHDSWVNHQQMNPDASHFGDLWGRGYAELTIAGLQIWFDRENGIVDAEGLIGSTLAVEALKYTTQRPRPESQTNTSFPSGHTQVAFATATNLAISYGWKAGIPAYGLAVLTGLSRLADDAHWFSDVVAGAPIGILFGRAGFAHHAKVNVSPMVIQDGGRGGGLVLGFSF